MFRVFNRRSTPALLLVAATLPLTIASTQAEARSRAKKAAIAVVSDANRWAAIDASGWLGSNIGITTSRNLSLGQWLNSH
jgi:hypothetical protein